MNIIYLRTIENWKEAVKGKINRYNLWVKKTDYLYRRLFNIPYSNNVYPNNTEYVLPYTATETKKIIKFLKRRKNVQGIVLDKRVLKNQEILSKVKENQIYIFDGKWIFRYIIIEILQYICERTNLKMNEINVAILVNHSTDENIQTILKLVDIVKNTSIITKEINKFYKIEKKLYEEKGIPIKLSNNKKKSLKKEKIIINMDFTEKELKSYEICQDAIIINIKNNVNNINKYFCGININNCEIEKTEYDIKDFFSTNIYESIIYRKDIFTNIRLQIKKDRIKIKYLIGTRGKIQEDEYKNFIKTIDKNDNLT